MKGLKCLLALLVMMTFAQFAWAEPIETVQPSCSVTVNGEAVRVYETAVSHQRFWTENPELSSTPVAIATVDGASRVEVEFFDADVTSAVVRPLSLGVEPEIADGKVVFDLPGPGNVTVEYNGQVGGAAPVRG